MCLCGLFDALLLRQDTHTFAAFVDIRKAFDTSWIEATLVRLSDVGVTGGMWRKIANFLCVTFSQVRDHDGVSAPGFDTGIVSFPSLFQSLLQRSAVQLQESLPILSDGMPTLNTSSPWSSSMRLVGSRRRAPSVICLPSVTFGVEFLGNCSCRMARCDAALRQWSRHLLGWPSGSPNASVLYELGLPGSLRISQERALALFGRLNVLAAGGRLPITAAVFAIARQNPGSWAHWCQTLLEHHDNGHPADHGIGPRCSPALR